VAKSLDRLRDTGLRLATLTNSTRQVAEAQMENPALRDYFDAFWSDALASYARAAERRGGGVKR
jgi:FMN phosphatase YigB (HAD superfamily)